MQSQPKTHFGGNCSIIELIKPLLSVVYGQLHGYYAVIICRIQRTVYNFTTLPTESVVDVRMLHMQIGSAMAATVALLLIKLEGTTSVRVKILYYHDMLLYHLPIHLYKHLNMIYLFKSPCIFLNCTKTYCLRFVWIPYRG